MKTVMELMEEENHDQDVPPPSPRTPIPPPARRPAPAVPTAAAGPVKKGGRPLGRKDSQPRKVRADATPAPAAPDPVAVA